MKHQLERRENVYFSIVDWEEPELRARRADPPPPVHLPEISRLVDSKRTRERR